jgi:hypothetical protein
MNFEYLKLLFDLDSEDSIEVCRALGRTRTSIFALGPAKLSMHLHITSSMVLVASYSIISYK